MLVVKDSSLNTYGMSKDYKKTSTERGVEYRGQRYHKKIIYEKKLDKARCLGLGVLAFLATLTIVPYLCNLKKVTTWWQQAISGVDRKIVLIKEDTHEKRVQFGAVRARLFNANESPDEIQCAQSMELVHEDIEKGVVPETPQERRIPTLFSSDTMACTENDVLMDERRTNELFRDADIVEKLGVIKRVSIGPNVYANFTQHGKAIIQQQTARGCSAANAAMLIMDNEKNPDLQVLQTRNLGSSEDQIGDIQNAGLKAVMREARNLAKLRELLIENGSAIVPLYGSLGSHAVVVDAVAKDLSKVRLRDPYHGWEITVRSEVFLNEWRRGKVIQIEKRLDE